MSFPLFNIFQAHLFVTDPVAKDDTTEQKSNEAADNGTIAAPNMDEATNHRTNNNQHKSYDDSKQHDGATLLVE